MGRREGYLLAVLALAVVSLAMAVLIVLGEVQNHYVLGGAALGVLLMAYGLIVLLLRKLGILGPRKAEGR